MTRFAEALKRAESVETDAAVDREARTLRVFKPSVLISDDRVRVKPDATGTGDRVRVKPDTTRPAGRVRLKPDIPRAASRPSSERFEWHAGDGPENQFAREQYNRLAASLHEAQGARGIKAVLVTSAVPREGKTRTVSNLALTLSESYQRRVLLIDADLRRPMVHTLFGVPNEPGFSETLAGGGPLPFVEATARLSLLTAGDCGGDPMKTLASDAMRRVVEAARSDFDWVLIDTPPIGLLPDASVLVSMADGVLLVALAGKTPYGVIQRAAETLGQDRIFGVVLNGVSEAHLPHPYEHAYYGAEKPTRC